MERRRRLLGWVAWPPAYASAYYLYYLFIFKNNNNIDIRGDIPGFAHARAYKEVATLGGV